MRKMFYCLVVVALILIVPDPVNNIFAFVAHAGFILASILFLILCLYTKDSDKW